MAEYLTTQLSLPHPAILGRHNDAGVATYTVLDGQDGDNEHSLHNGRRALQVRRP